MTGPRTAGHRALTLAFGGFDATVNAELGWVGDRGLAELARAASMIADAACRELTGRHGSDGEDPGTPAEVIRRAIANLTHPFACCFDLCPGPGEPYVQMATCRVCATVQDLRGLLARLEQGQLTPPG